MFVETDRLILRAWREEDLAPFARLNADTEVMRYFERPFTREESDESVKRFTAGIETHGFGLWAAELKLDNSFIGLIGLQGVGSDLFFGPTIEIGWRLQKDVWGQGLAPEGALGALAFAFEEKKVPEVVSFTAACNVPSRRVMEKVGMTTEVSEDFDHPRVTKGHMIERHCLYRLSSADFKPF